MPIDWFTVAAQVLNFLALVWLMKRFLYKPVLAAIAAREKAIGERLSDAEAKGDQARKVGDEYRRKNEEFDRHREGLLSDASDQAGAMRQKLLEEARAQADLLATKRRDGLEAQYANLELELGRKARQEVYAVARKALADLATCDLEERMAAVFAQRLRAMEGPAKEAFAAALASASEPAVVRSVFELGQPLRDMVGLALNEAFHAEVPLRFETSPELVAGVEISSNGQKMAWNVSEYLELLEQDVRDLLGVQRT